MNPSRSATSDRQNATRTPSSAKNVVANWAGQAITIVSGFVLPRLINDSMGPAELGVWDFGWSMRGIIAMSQLGMGSATGHYVSRFRATEDWDSLNRVLSATFALVVYAAVIAMAVTAVMWWLTPTLMRSEAPELVVSAQWMIAAMGVAAVIQMFTTVYGGVLVGSHRFDLLNAVEISADVLMVAAILVAIAGEWGLKVMAVCVAARHCLDFAAKRVIARRICPQFRLRPRWTDWRRFREIAAYGAKTSADTVGTIIRTQALIVLVLFFHNAATVALFARPLALVRHTTRFLMGYARILVPKAGEAFERGDRAEAGQLLIHGTRTSLYLACPIAVLLLVMGGPILTLWMGPEYADSTVLVILVAGYFPFFAQRATWHILLGMGAHGLPAIASLVGALVSVGLGYLFLGLLDWGLPGAALAIAVPVGLVNLLVLPYVGCRTVGIAVARYFVTSGTGPLAATIPFAVILAVVRLWFADQPLTALAVGLTAGVPVLLFIYWRVGLLALFVRRRRRVDLQGR